MLPTMTSPDVSRRADELFKIHCNIVHRRTDRLFAYLMLFQFFAGLACAAAISPRAWEGSQSYVHVHVWAALVLGGTITALPIILAIRHPGKALTRHTIATGQMLTSALLIHLTGGRIETHFHIFGSLAFIAFYRDWRVFIPATVVIALDHLIRGLFWPESVYGILTASPWRFLEHAGWVLFEDAVLLRSCFRSVQEMKNIAGQRARLENTNTIVEEEVHQRTLELHEQATKLRKEIAQRHRIETALRKSEASTRAILDNAPDGIITANHDASIITSINPAGAAMFGYLPAELEGQPLTTIIPGSPDGADNTGVESFLATGKSQSIGETTELTGLHRSGTGIPIEMRLTSTNVGKEMFFTAVFRDITSRKQSEVVERERNSLRDAVSAHEQVLGVVGHELRTPLAAIRAMSEFLLDEGSRQSEEADSFLRSIHEQVQRMAEMVNDLLEVARLNSGVAKWNWSSVDLSSMCRQAIEAVRALTDSAKVALEQDVAVAGLTMNGDAGGIRRLLTNLLTNACKHTQAGSVSVRVAEISEASGRQIRIEVRDTGEGMTPEVAKRLGMAFALNSGIVGESHVKGSGLGMTICKGIIAAHGGSMSIDTAPGQGTNVTVLLQADLIEPAPVNDAAEIICQV